MKKSLFTLLIGLFVISHLPLQAQTKNMAVRLDGRDNKLSTGLGILSESWTLEARIYHDKAHAGKTAEYIFGGGEYSDLNWVENRALYLKNGNICAHRPGISIPYPDDGKWHHVALTCDKNTTSLYIDGICRAKRDTSYAVLPGSIGVLDTKYTFSGLMDEVRIWNCALDESTLKRWSCTNLLNSHPSFAHLIAYYPMDDFNDEMGLNWVCRSPRVTHLRNERSNFRGIASLAHAVPNDDPSFHAYEGRQKLFSATTVQNEWDADCGSCNQQALKLRLCTNGSKKPLQLTDLWIDFSKSTDPQHDIQAVHIYYTGGEARSAERMELFGGPLKPQSDRLQLPKDKSLVLQEGVNYLLVTFDISPQASLGNVVHAGIPKIKISGKEVRPIDETSQYKQISGNYATDSCLFKLMQWNIWHGGVHLGYNGKERIIDELRKANADSYHLQEAYGIQRYAADTLGLHLNSRSHLDNLAQLSRHPLTSMPSRRSFISCPSLLTLPNGKQLITVDCWLRYAYRPEYTGLEGNRGMDPSVWVAEDSTLALRDIQIIVEEDLPKDAGDSIPVLLSGDFNSFSHLDWTARSADLHYGYGPIDFPVSKYMISHGFIDTFRQLHPDERLHPGCTWAPIYGQNLYSRIDFIYSKGNVRPVLSKIIRSSSETDFVWPGDHAAVITVFELPKDF